MIKFHEEAICRKKYVTAEYSQALEVTPLYTKTAKRKGHETFRWSGRFFLAVVLFIALLPISDAFSQQQPVSTTPGSVKFGYYYKGKFIQLTPDEGLIAMSETGAKFKVLFGAKELNRDPLSERKQLKERKLGLYRFPLRVRTPQTKMNIGLLMEKIAKQTDREIQPVFSQGQALLIPSDEIIVRFKKAATLEKATTFFSKYENTQGIVDVKKHRKNTYILKINNPSKGRVYKVCQLLSGLNEVEFAEPNHIVLLLDAPTVPMPPGGAPASGSSGGGSSGGSTGNSPVTWTNLADESFEGPSLPAGWSTGRLENTFTNAFWSVTNHRKHAGNQSVYATGGGTEGVSPPGPYPNNSYSWMDTPVLNLAGYEEVYIEFWFYAKYEDTDALFCSVPDLAAVGVFNPVSGTTTFLSALAICSTGDLTSDPTTDNGWRRALVRVSPSLRLNGIKVRFVFLSDGNNTKEGLYVDQIRIVGTADVDTEPLGNDTYSGRHYEMKNSGQIAGLGNDSNDMNVPEAWSVISVSSNLVVAAIDSGVDLGHPDLNLDPGFDFDGTGDGHHRGSHGTAVAGNIGAIGNNSLGVMSTAPGVRIMPVYMGSSNGEIASAIDTAVAKNADVLSNSWGWVGAPSSDIEDAIIDALNAGTVVLFAAGNGPDRFPWTYLVAFPGNLTGSTDVICVGASSPTDEHKAAASSDGSFGWGSSYVGHGPDVVAPSPWSYTTDIRGVGGYNDGSLIDPSNAVSADYTPTFGGTSSATPKVAGIVGLLLSVNPNLTPQQVKEILRETADDIDSPGVDDKTGAGRVNAYRAVTPSVKISVLPTIVKRNKSFKVKVTATAPHGLKEIGWFGQNTGIPSIDQEHWDNISGGVPGYTGTFDVTISQTGTYTLAANARDLLYPNPGDAYPHQASDGSGIATTQIKVVPVTTVLGLLALWFTFLVTGTRLLRKCG